MFCERHKELFRFNGATASEPWNLEQRRGQKLEEVTWLQWGHGI